MLQSHQAERVEMGGWKLLRKIIQRNPKKFTKNMKLSEVIAETGVDVNAKYICDMDAETYEVKH